MSQAKLRAALQKAVAAKEAELEGSRRNLGRDPMVKCDWLDEARAALSEQTPAERGLEVAKMIHVLREFGSPEVGTVVVFPELLRHAAALIERLSVPPENNDTARLNWLCRQSVDVKRPLRHGYRNLFVAGPDLEHEFSDLRAQIDAVMTPPEAGTASAMGEQTINSPARSAPGQSGSQAATVVDRRQANEGSIPSGTAPVPPENNSTPLAEALVPWAEVINEPCQGCGKRPVDFLTGHPASPEPVAKALQAEDGK